MLHLTEHNYDKIIQQSPLPIVVMFYATWCSKCAMMKPIVEETEKLYAKQIIFCEIDIDESISLSEKYGADTVPTFLFYQNQTLLGAMQGIIDEHQFQRRLNKIFINS